MSEEAQSKAPKQPGHCQWLSALAQIAQVIIALATIDQNQEHFEQLIAKKSGLELSETMEPPYLCLKDSSAIAPDPSEHSDFEASIKADIQSGTEALR